MYCQKCGAKIDDEACVCVHCGAHVRKLPDEEQSISQTQPKKPQSVEESLEELRYRRQQQHIENTKREEYGEERGYYPAYGYYRKTNGMAIAGFVCAFFSAILGIVFSVIAMNQCEERGEEGYGLAQAGRTIAIVRLFLSFVVTIIVVAAVTAG